MPIVALFSSATEADSVTCAISIAIGLLAQGKEVTTVECNHEDNRLSVFVEDFEGSQREQHRLDIQYCWTVDALEKVRQTCGRDPNHFVIVAPSEEPSAAQSYAFEIADLIVMPVMDLDEGRKGFSVAPLVIPKRKNIVALPYGPNAILDGQVTLQIPVLSDVLTAPENLEAIDETGHLILKGRNKGRRDGLLPRLTSLASEIVQAAEPGFRNTTCRTPLMGYDIISAILLLSNALGFERFPNPSYLLHAMYTDMDCRTSQLTVDIKIMASQLQISEQTVSKNFASWCKLGLLVPTPDGSHSGQKSYSLSYPNLCTLAIENLRSKAPYLTSRFELFLAELEDPSTDVLGPRS